MPQIIITVKPDGETVIEVKGAKGPRCKELTKSLEQALGKVTESTPTAEWYEKVTTENHVTLHNGGS